MSLKVTRKPRPVQHEEVECELETAIANYKAVRVAGLWFYTVTHLVSRNGFTTSHPPFELFAEPFASDFRAVVTRVQSEVGQS